SRSCDSQALDKPHQNEHADAESGCCQEARRGIENYSDDQQGTTPPCIGESSTEELRRAVADDVSRNSPLNVPSRNSEVRSDRRKRRHVDIDGGACQRDHGEQDKQPKRKITLELC